MLKSHCCHSVVPPFPKVCLSFFPYCLFFYSYFFVIFSCCSQPFSLAFFIFSCFFSLLLLQILPSMSPSVVLTFINSKMVMRANSYEQISLMTEPNKSGCSYHPLPPFKFIFPSSFFSTHVSISHSYLF